MTARDLLSLLCHLGVFVGRAGLFVATAWALIYSRPARLSFLTKLPEQMQPVVADLYGTVWAYAIVALLGGIAALTRYAAPWVAMGITAANAGAGMGLAIHVARLARGLPSYVRGGP